MRGGRALAGAFQDFFRFEFRGGRPSGSATCRGWTTCRPCQPRSNAAAPTTWSTSLPRASRRSSDQPGPSGVELSFGQWQKLALARGFMRERPLLLVLDEPTAALDAETEHALFERFAAAARGGRRLRHDPRRRPDHDPGLAPIQHRVAWPTSSWCSTARGWSNRDARRTVARGGQYAELYAIQAAAYR